jgi:hypothetical protein
MATGAALGYLFGALMFLPGVIPWWEYSWGHGLVFGFFLGVPFYPLVLWMTRQHTQNQGPKA